MNRKDFLKLVVATGAIYGCDLAESDGSGLAEAGSWRVDPTPVAVVGELEGAPEYLFEQILSIKFADDQRFVVADFGATSLRAYDLSGRFLRELGRVGEGPGEFGGIAGMWMSPPDTVAIYDHRLGKRTSFLLDGTFVESVSLEREGHPDHVAGAFNDGSIVLGWADFGESKEAIVPDKMSYGRWGPDGQYLGTMTQERGMWRYASSSVRGPVPLAGVHPHSPFPHPWVQGETMFFTNGVKPDVSIRDKDGGLIRTISVPIPAISAAQARAELQQSLTEREIAARLDGVPEASTVPHISEMLVDDQGLIWVRSYEPGEDSAWLASFRSFSGGHWLVVDQDGEVRAEVELPADLILKDVRGSMIVGVTKDELNVERVVVHRILGRT